MTLVEKQNEFAKSLVRLLTWIDLNGYQVTLGEAYRPEWVAAEYAAKSTGIVKSLHTLRLAIDLNLFVSGVMAQISDYKKAGDFWESLSTPELTHVWGGAFETPDSDHFSISHNGVR